jgi:hypothetical protein
MKRPKQKHVNWDLQPVWMAALQASGCHAVLRDREHGVDWEWIADRAVYTNNGPGTEVIQPLGISLRSGDTLAVFWAPAQTTYTTETYRQPGLCQT